MYETKQPLFQAEGHPMAEFTTQSWGKSLREMSETLPTDEQTETDSDVEEVIEEGDQETQIDGDTEDEGTEEVDEPTAPAFTDDTEIELGEDRKAVKLAELKAGYLRQSDYTKKTQELATQRTELESQRESLKDAQGFKTHMESNPWLWEQINHALNSFESTGVLPIEEVLQDAQYGKYLNHMMAENTKLKKELESVQGEYEGVKLTTSIQSLQNDLKSEYGDLVTPEYMETLQTRAKEEKLSTATLKEIADGHLAKQALQSNKKDTKKAEAQAIQKLAETKRTAPSAPKKVGATPAANVPTGNSGSWSDFFAGLKRPN